MKIFAAGAVLGLVLGFAVAFLALPRYTLATMGNAGGAFKLDRWTGTTWVVNGYGERLLGPMKEMSTPAQ